MASKLLINWLSAPALLLWLLSGCGGNGSGEPDALDDSQDQASERTAYLVDSPVSGIRFVRSDGSRGETGVDGAFQYFPGDVVEFYVGDTLIGSLRTRVENTYFSVFSIPETVTPVDLTPDADDPDHPTALNKLIFLQTLDKDGDLDNGIQISASVHQAFVDKHIDFEVGTDEFVTGKFSAVLDKLNRKGAFTGNTPREVQSTIDALRHYDNYLETITFPYPEQTPPVQIYYAWWPKLNCAKSGKTMLQVSNNRVLYCPNIRANDGCFEGVRASNGKVLLPRIEANAECAKYDSAGTPLPEDCLGYDVFKLHTELTYPNLRTQTEGYTGVYQASCAGGPINQISGIDLDFVHYETLSDIPAEGFVFEEAQSYLDDLDLQLQAQTHGRCEVAEDCQVLSLPKSTTKCERQNYSYAPAETDPEDIDFLAEVYSEIASEIYGRNRGTGSEWCFPTIPAIPAAACVQNQCQLEM